MEIKKCIETLIDNLDESLHRVSESSIGKFSSRLMKHDRVFLIGAGREGLATRAFAMRLMHIGKEAHWVWDDTTPGVNDNDLIVVASGSGKIPTVHHVAKKAKEEGAFIVTVTGNPDRKTPQIADHVIHLPAEVFGGGKNVVSSEQQPMGSLYEQALLLFYDVVVLDLIDKMNVTFEEMESRHRNVE